MSAWPPSLPRGCSHPASRHRPPTQSKSDSVHYLTTPHYAEAPTTPHICLTYSPYSITHSRHCPFNGQHALFIFDSLCLISSPIYPVTRPQSREPARSATTPSSTISLYPARSITPRRHITPTSKQVAKGLALQLYTTPTRTKHIPPIVPGVLTVHVQRSTSSARCPHGFQHGAPGTSASLCDLIASFRPRGG